MTSLTDVEVGAAALRDYVATISELAGWVPWGTYEAGARIVCNAWDGVGKADNPDAVDLKKANCGMALYKSIYDAGYGNRITPDQCGAGADAVLKATKRI
jgi:hypothetical protein